MTIIERSETYSDGTLVEQEELHDDGTVTVTDGNGNVTETHPATPETLTRVAAAAEQTNRRTIEDALRQAIADNLAILNRVQAGQNVVDQNAADADTLTPSTSTTSEPRKLRSTASART